MSRLVCFLNKTRNIFSELKKKKSPFFLTKLILHHSQQCNYFENLFNLLFWKFVRARCSLISQCSREQTTVPIALNREPNVFSYSGELPSCRRRAPARAAAPKNRWRLSIGGDARPRDVSAVSMATLYSARSCC